MNLRLVKRADCQGQRYVLYLDVSEIEVHSGCVRWRKNNPESTEYHDWKSCPLEELDTFGVYLEDTTPFLRSQMVSIAGDELVGQHHIPTHALEDMHAQIAATLRARLQEEDDEGGLER